MPFNVSLAIQCLCCNVHRYFRPGDSSELQIKWFLCVFFSYFCAEKSTEKAAGKFSILIIN